MLHVFHSQAIELALEQAENASAETTIFLDDSTRNIVAGHQRGLTTILVSRCHITQYNALLFTLDELCILYDCSQCICPSMFTCFVMLDNIVHDQR